MTMKGIFGDLFDFNGDGKLDAMEQAVDFGVFMEKMEKDEREDADDEDWDDEI